MAAEHFLIATPDLDTIDAINAQYEGLTAPPVRLLPSDLAPVDLAHQSGSLYPAPERVVIGQREQDLAPAALDFRANPLLMVFGDNRSGKTTLLRHVIRTLRDNNDPDDLAFTVIDRRLHLVDEQLFPDNEYTTNVDRVLPAMLGLSALIAERRPPTGLTARELAEWSAGARAAQKHYLIIDDVDQIPDTPAMAGPFVGQRPWAGLVGLLSEAGDLGLRVVVTARATGSGHNLMTNPLLRRLNELQATTIMLSGNPQDGGKIRGNRFTRAPAGRAMLLDDSDLPVHLQLAHPHVVEHATHGEENPS